MAHEPKTIWKTLPQSAIVADLIKLPSYSSSKFKLIIILTGLLTLIGLIAIWVKFGFYNGQQEQWGYIAASLAFIFGITTGAPILAIASLFGKAAWNRILGRFSVLLSIGSISVTLLAIPLILQLPPLVVDGIRRRSIWLEAPNYSPHVWIMIALFSLILVSLGLIYSNCIPDLMIMREKSTGWRKRVATILTRGWYGTDHQWRTLKIRIFSFSVLFLLIAIFLQVIFPIDLAMSLVPGWRDAIFPFYHLITSLQAGIAALILFVSISIKVFNLEKYLGIDVLWLLGRVLFVATLFWVYFFFSEFIVFWYGRNEADILFLELFVTGPYMGVFIASVIFIFVAPFLTLLWNRFRRSMLGPVVASVLVLTGNILDRVRIYTSSWIVPPESIHELSLKEIPLAVAPDALDVLVFIGSVGAFIFSILLLIKIVPVVSPWQMLEYNLLVRPYKYIKTKGIIIAKPD